MFVVCSCARVHQHLPLYLTHLLTYLYKQASSVSSIRVSVRGLCLLMLVVEEGEDASSTTTLTNTTPNTDHTSWSKDIFVV